jgi:hypothetical protein
MVITEPFQLTVGLIRLAVYARFRCEDVRGKMHFTTDPIPKFRWTTDSRTLLFRSVVRRLAGASFSV